MDNAGLGMLFQNLGPATAALVAGERDARAEQDAAIQRQIQQADLEKATLANMFAKQNNPQLLEKQRLANTALGYENDVASVKSASALANKDKTIAEEGAVLDTKTLAARAQGQETLGRLGAQLAPQLAAIPDAQKAQAVQGYLQQMGIDPNNATVQGIFGQLKGVPPSQWPALLTNYSNKLIESSAAYKQQMDVARMNRDSAEKVAAGNNATQLRIAQMSQEGQDRRAEMKKAAASKAKSIEDGVATGKIGYEKAATYYSFLAMNEDDPELKTQYEQRASQFETAELRKRQAMQQGRPDINAMAGLPTQQVQPALGGQAPKMGTAENPIVLK